MLSDGDPDPDGTLKTVVRVKILHYVQLYLNRPDPIGFLTVSVHRRNRIDFASFTLFV
jgi:hypothetical protein